MGCVELAKFNRLGKSKVAVPSSSSYARSESLVVLRSSVVE
jgi:hypothetical protein